MNLHQHVQSHIARGGRVESFAPDGRMAVVVYGKRPNHILHLLLSVITLALWVPVWIIIDITNRPRRVVLMVDAYGNVTETQHKQAISLVGKLRQRRKG